MNFKKSIFLLVALLTVGSAQAGLINKAVESIKNSKFAEMVDYRTNSEVTIRVRVDLTHDENGLEILECDKINLMDKSYIGRICETKQGYYFKRIETGIQEIDTKLTISLEMQNNLNQDEAIQYCKQKGQALPTGWPRNYNGRFGYPNTYSEFEMLENMGIRQVLKDMTGKAFWSSTRVMDTGYAYSAYYEGGSVFLEDREHVIVQKESYYALCLSYPWWSKP